MTRALCQADSCLACWELWAGPGRRSVSACSGWARQCLDGGPPRLAMWVREEWFLGFHKDPTRFLWIKMVASNPFLLSFFTRAPTAQGRQQVQQLRVQAAEPDPNTSSPGPACLQPGNPSCLSLSLHTHGLIVKEHLPPGL